MKALNKLVPVKHLVRELNERAIHPVVSKLLRHREIFRVNVLVLSFLAVCILQRSFPPGALLYPN
jgi:hypothetical protein